ncbi:alpha/beta hydrolase [Rhodovarius crocodyli]|nr:alpha/beta hydrolase [Rhodovarius crocodyli]
MRRPLLASLGALLASACSPVTLLNAVAPSAGVRVAKDIAYGPLPRHRLDVYAPMDARGAPVVVFYYGGGWEAGDRAMYHFLGAAMAAEGMVCVIPDYRLFPEVRFPTFIEDGATALAWAKREATAQGGDPARLFVMGHSAGAHIAAMLAVNPRYLAPRGLSQRDLRGFVGLAGPYDFLPLTSQRLREIFGPEQGWPATQPINLVTAEAPPAFLATGDRDTTVYPRNTENLAARLRAAGVPVETRTYEAIGHVQIMGAMAGPLRFLCPVREDVLRFIRGRSA